jgi:pyruvate-formate lyase-activating enzyme
MKKYLALALLGSSLFASQFVQKYNIALIMQTNKAVLDKVTNLNKEVKNNKKCEIKENIQYTKDDKYPYNITLNISCNSNDNKDIEKIKNIVSDIVKSKNVKIEEYATETYQASEEKYKNEKEFLDKHKDAARMLNKALFIQQQMQKEIQKEMQEMQKLFN